MSDNYIEHRPWGSFENLLDESYCKVKRIIVKPDQGLSYQYHHESTEHWVVVQGEATVTLDDEEYEYHVGDVVEIPVGTKHRVENKSLDPLVFIEVQYGGYFGEDDIVRLDDKYNRK